MRTHARAAPLAALALIALPLLACGGDRGETTVDTPPAAETAGEAVRVTQVELGNAIGTDKRVTAPATEFRPTDTIYATVVTEGSSTATTLTARWTFEDGQVVDESTQSVAPNGTAVTEFHVSKPDGWPAGTYRVEILLNGTRAEEKTFTIR